MCDTANKCKRCGAELRVTTIPEHPNGPPKGTPIDQVSEELLYGQTIEILSKCGVCNATNDRRTNN